MFAASTAEDMLQTFLAKAGTAILRLQLVFRPNPLARQ
jgi:hypothetical protein